SLPASVRKKIAGTRLPSFPGPPSCGSSVIRLCSWRQRNIVPHTVHFRWEIVEQSQVRNRDGVHEFWPVNLWALSLTKLLNKAAGCSECFKEKGVFHRNRSFFFEDLLASAQPRHCLLLLLLAENPDAVRCEDLGDPVA